MEATPGQWFCVVWTACRAAAPPSTGEDPSLVVLAAEHGAQKTFLGHLVVSGGTDEPFFMKRRFSIKTVGAEFSVVSKAFLLFVAFSVERDGNKTGGDRM